MKFIPVFITENMVGHKLSAQQEILEVTEERKNNQALKLINGCKKKIVQKK